MRKKIMGFHTLKIFSVNFLFFFMLLIFGPAEIFFANAAEFSFVYGEFAGYLAILALGVSFILTFIEIFLPEKIRRVLLSVTFGISLAGYLQVMFLNKDLDMLGLNPDGYQIQTVPALVNLLIWLLLIAGVIFIAFRKEKIWKKAVPYCSIFLLCIQLIALVSLMLTAGEGAYHHKLGDWKLSGKNQLTVSADKNIIVLILDYTSSEEIMLMNQAYPGSTDFLHDFTSYTNADSVYYGTYPSLPHMLTGCELDMGKRVNEWCADIWQDEKTTQFYSALHDKNYIVNLYTPDTNIICGLNDTEVLRDKFDNLENAVDEIDVFYKLLFKTITKMSAYRMFPEIIKPYFYTNMSEYTNIITYKESQILHENYYFYDALLERGLTADKSGNYLIVQHLLGTHDHSTDENCHQREDEGPIEDSAKGCMVMVEEYLNQLKQLGVYDDATIIITADHGTFTWSQVLFYVKGPGETHDTSPLNNAPVSFREFLPTLAEYAGLDYTQYGSGESIHDYTEEDRRERTYWVRNATADYPFVPCYTGERDGISNIYYGYTYTGDLQDMKRIDWSKPSLAVPMVDSYF